MPLYRIHRMRDHVRQSFRWAPHVSGAAPVKHRDYIAGAEVEATNEYEAWAALRTSATPLEVGDLLESPTGELRICKYVGFEAASWVIPEAKPAAAGEAPAEDALAPAPAGEPAVTA